MATAHGHVSSNGLLERFYADGFVVVPQAVAQSDVVTAKREINQDLGQAARERDKKVS
jgi:hypothetical protein